MEPGPSKTTEICIVFKKNTLLVTAQAFLNTLRHPYREGSDSSRGRLYFEQTGPKFIVTVDHTEMELFLAMIRVNPDVHEAYEANFEIFKD